MRILGFSLLVIGFIIGIVIWKKSRRSTLFGHAHFANALEIKEAGLFSHQGIILGKAFGRILRLPGFESALITAPVGSGKTTAIAIPNLIEWQGSGIFNDLKGELYTLTAKYREQVLNNQCYRFSPASHNSTTHCYNPFYYVSDNPDFRIRDIQLIGFIVIPSTNTGSDFWHTTSRDIFLMLALYLIEKNGTATLAGIHDQSKINKFFEWLEKNRNNRGS